MKGRVALFVIGLTLVGVGAWGIWKRGRPQPAPPASLVSNAAEYQQVQKTLQNRDNEIMESKSPQDFAPEDRFAALVRLGKAKDLRARDRALRWVDDKDPQIREGVANALGNFDDELSFMRLEKLLDDAQLRVRLQALKALGALPGEGRIAVLRKLIPKLASEENQSFGPAGWAIAYQSLFGAAGGRMPGLANFAETREEALQGLIKVARKAKRLEARNEAFATLASSAPRDPRVIELLHTHVTESKDAVSVANSIRQLAVIGDPWLTKNLTTLWERGSIIVRGSLLQVLPILCPDSRWTLLGEATQAGTGGDFLAITALDVIASMRGTRADEILTRIAKAPAGRVSNAVRARAAEIAASPPSVVDPCTRSAR